MEKNRFFRTCLILSEIFSVWYISSAFLLYQTRLGETLTGFTQTAFVLYTRFFADPMPFAAVQVVWLPIAVSIFAVVVSVCAKHSSRSERLAFVSAAADCRRTWNHQNMDIPDREHRYRGVCIRHIRQYALLRGVDCLYCGGANALNGSIEML